MEFWYAERDCVLKRSIRKGGLKYKVITATTRPAIAKKHLVARIVNGYVRHDGNKYG
jgi:hypothetical protein